jgi:DNA mismatch repair protein MutS2
MLDRSSAAPDKLDHRAEDPAAEIRAETLDLLDFQSIRRRLADLTSFSGARQLALGLTPSHDRDEVEHLQRETAEGRVLLEEVGGVSLYTDSDITEALARAELEGVLTGSELLAVVQALEVQASAQAAVRRAGERVPILARLAAGIPDLEELRRQVGQRIGASGEVVDDATPALRVIRRQVRQAYEDVTQALSRVIQSSTGREALQDQVISVRGDRLVVQVKTEMRHRIPGIVHDASNTGATLFMEPLATVELCNAWREIVLEEEREVARVLRDLSTLVGALATDIRRGAELVASLDLILARGQLSAEIGGVRPLAARTVDSPEPTPEVVRLLNARHPLLGRSAVPINMSIGPDWTTLVITGPNTGGKTVAMKTLGLLSLMHQSGLHISADEGSSLPVFDGVYADVGDQQSIERSVSTFSSHMRRVIDILEVATPYSLVLLDELGTSTDPEEGSALAKAILSHLASRGVSSVVTTHHRTVAAHAEATPGMMNASVRLDASTLEPTYQLTTGIPGRSYAMSVAARLGLPPEIMASAESLMEPQHLRFEDWLKELQDQRDQLQLRVQEAEEARGRATALREQLDAQLEHLVEHRDDILDSVRRKLVAQNEEVRRKLRRAEAALSWNAPQGDVTDARARTEKVRQEMETLRLPDPPLPRRREATPLSEGDRVYVRGLNLEGTIASLPEGVEEAEVHVGNVRLRIERARLSRIETSAEEAPEVAVGLDLGPALDTMEVDLRGMRVEEALVRLEEFLDQALRDGLSSVRIIHGRGTGALREAVRDHLERHPLARTYAPESPDRGGNGATSVELT